MRHICLEQQLNKPSSITTNNVTIDYYEVTIQPFEKQVFPNLGTASMVGYNAMTPGPTYWIERGRQTVIRYHNNQTQTSVVHLHGSNSTFLHKHTRMHRLMENSTLAVGRLGGRLHRAWTVQRHVLPQ